MENIDLVGIWKVVGCVVLCKNSDLSNFKGASLILRPDGSFSWFGPVSQGVLDLNTFCAYKVERAPLKHSQPDSQTAVSHPSMCLLFESDQHSTCNPYLCCEVTVKFGNSMVIQFPGLCLMHFRRVSNDFENSNNSAIGGVGSGCNSLSPNKPGLSLLVENNVGYCGDNSWDIRHTDSFSLANVSNTDNPGSCTTSASAKTETGYKGFQSALYCDSQQASIGISKTIEPLECKSLECFSLPEMDSHALTSSMSPVKSKQKTMVNSDCNPGTRASSEDSAQVQRDISNDYSCPLNFFPAQNTSSPVMPSDLTSNVSFTSLQPTQVLQPPNAFECSSSHPQDCYDKANPSAKKENNIPVFMGESNDVTEDYIDDLENNSLEEPASPSSSSTGSSSSTAQLLSHKCQDHSFSLLRALQEGYFSDLILVAENGVKFEVHSTILALSFPNIIWENGDEDDNQQKNLRCSEKNASASSMVPELFIEAASKTSKKQEVRYVVTELQKCKLKMCTLHHCYSTEKSYSKSPEIEEDVQAGNPIDSGKYVKPPSKQKENPSKVKLPCMPEAVLRALLHYAYSESLPTSLAPETAHLCVKLLSPPCPVAPHTAAFRNLCSAYLRNTALRQDIVSLTSEIHGCLSKMEEHLTMGDYHGMMSSEEEEEEDDVGRRRERAAMGVPRDKNLPQPTPGRLCTALKQAAREAAVAIVLALELCQVYAKNHCHLGKMEIHEVAQFAASRLAPLASQLDAVLSALLRSIPPASSPIATGAPHSPPLHSHQHLNGHEHQLPHGEGTTLRDRLASHLVPEMESALEVLSNLSMCLKEDLEEVLEASQESATPKNEREDVTMANKDLGTNFQQVYKDSRIEMLSYVHQRISFYLFHLLQKKESFSDLGNGGRFRVICQTLDQLSEELPIFLLRLRDALATIDEQLAPEHLSQPLAEWTTKVSGLLSLLSTHRSILQPLLLTVTDLVQRETFLFSLRRLELLNYVADDDEAGCPISSSTVPSSLTESDSTYGLSLVRSLVTPPSSRRSHLSRRALRLLQTSSNSDMVFQVALPTLSGCDADNPPTIDYGSNFEILRLGSLEWDEDDGHWVWRVGAHRAIVAARCDWFRRALLSGMKEAINRQIVVHDTTPQLMQLFLQWIYGGKLEFEWKIYKEEDLPREGRKELGQHPNGTLAAEQLWALLVLADQLEVDDLKSACEHLLLSGGFHLADPEATLACLSLADQVNARAVRSACLQHISCNPSDVVESELFDELPTSLQSEVYDRLIWSRPRKSQTTEWLLSTPEEDEDYGEEEGKFSIKPLNPLNEHSFLNEASTADADQLQHNHGNASRDRGDCDRNGSGDGACSEI